MHCSIRSKVTLWINRRVRADLSYVHADPSFVCMDLSASAWMRAGSARTWGSPAWTLVVSTRTRENKNNNYFLFLFIFIFPSGRTRELGLSRGRFRTDGWTIGRWSRRRPWLGCTVASILKLPGGKTAASARMGSVQAMDAKGLYKWS
jgi:hypothetical protein